MKFEINDPRKDQIREAIYLIEQAQELVDRAVNDTSIEPNYRAYGRYGFDQLLNNGNPNDSGLIELIEEL